MLAADIAANVPLPKSIPEDDLFAMLEAGANA